MKENKFLYASFAAVIVLIFLFSAAQIPAAHQSPSDLPVAFVNEDEGEMGETLIERIKSQSSEMSTEGEQPIEWEIFGSKEEMMDALNDREIYGAFVIPGDYTEKSASLQSPEPQSPELEAFISQGSNMIVANVVEQAVSGMVEQMNQMMSEQMLAAAEESDASLSAEQVGIFAEPIQLNITHLHETGEMANAPLSLFQPLWMGSLISAILLFLAGKNRTFTNVKEKFKFRMIQVLTALVLGLLAGFSLTWFTTFMLGYEYDSFLTVASFLSITGFSFILLILTTMTWIGFGGIIIFVLLMFYGLPLVQMAPEMLPAFYQNWIYPWIPMRFMIDGLGEILFFSGSLWNRSTTVLIWILIISAIFQLSKIWVRKKA
ncbi:MAG TPA: DUF3533 domain-containing protein [Candidatus Salinicoccus merdavium]|nr:DUF3533 domain-containing protein [Candidatus Salinicoccus merdavium]